MLKIVNKTLFIKLLYYFVLIAFFFPRGFFEISNLYKSIYVIWTWLAVLIIWIQLIGKQLSIKIAINKECIFITLYFISCIIITFFTRGGLISGLQQMLLYPSLCIFIVKNFIKNPELILNISINILIVTFSLNLFVFNLYFMNIFHISFLGHVQMISQIGILAIFLACLYWMLFHKKKVKVFYLIMISLITMLTTDADSATITAIILIFVFLVYKFKLSNLLTFKSSFYILCMLLVNIFFIYIVSINNIFINILGSLDFNGRNFIWKNGLLHISNKPFLGYGIDGILLEPFWTQWSGGGFNYAHNQIIQCLLDGGLVILLLFIFMLLSFTSKVKFINIRKYKILINSVILCLLFIMIFDSTTLYSYMYFILSVIYSLPCVISQLKY